jgi:Domain of unknown function (DUF4406)
MSKPVFAEMNCLNGCGYVTPILCNNEKDLACPKCKCTLTMCIPSKPVPLKQKQLRVYIAGPMTGLPGFNYANFNAIAKELRRLGCEVENPAENPDPPGKAWTGYMRMAIAQLVKCDTLALLPNWHTSRGADLERRIALEIGLRVVDSHVLVGELLNYGGSHA